MIRGGGEEVRWPGDISEKKEVARSNRSQCLNHACYKNIFEISPNLGPMLFPYWVGLGYFNITSSICSALVCSSTSKTENIGSNCLFWATIIMSYDFHTYDTWLCLSFPPVNVLRGTPCRATLGPIS